MEDQKPVLAKFEFPTNYKGISEEYAKVVDASCTAKGKDEMGCVKDGYLVLWTLVVEVDLENAPTNTFEWDRGVEDSGVRELTLILIGYYNFSSSAEDTTQLFPRAMVTVPSKRTAGAYERIGMIVPYIGDESDKWLNQCFDGVEKREIKIQTLDKILSRGVADEISTSAAILESVEEVEPVTNLVNGSSTQVVGLGTATRDSLGNNDATVLDKGRGSGRDVGLGEVAVSKSLKAVELSNVCEVQVESAVISLAELSLHGNLSITSSPVGVGREGGVNQVEGSGGDDVEVGVDGDGCSTDLGDALDLLQVLGLADLGGGRIRDSTTRREALTRRKSGGTAEEKSEDELRDHDCG
ncbi:hypothetical protein HG530_006981 [Fusarium avenaceum]|nr:hypothetical protein HG530_006981 [Fusarium avenaceum]